MTLPETHILPLHSGRIKEGGEGLDRYMSELVFTLQRQYEDVAQAINGNLKSNSGQDNDRWIPVLRDSANPATTFDYDYQIGWVFRRGIFVDIWFDISWSAVLTGTTAGNMEIDLPYQVAITDQKPFVGVLQPSGFTYTAGTDCVINARPNSYILDVFNKGDGFSTASQGSVTSGQLIGNIKYAGQGIERT